MSKRHIVNIFEQEEQIMRSLLQRIGEYVKKYIQGKKYIGGQYLAKTIYERTH